jgi:hypothetical protein
VRRDSVEKIKEGAASIGILKKTVKRAIKGLLEKLFFLDREEKLKYLALFYEKLNDLAWIG